MLFIVFFFLKVPNKSKESPGCFVKNNKVNSLLFLHDDTNSTTFSTDTFLIVNNKTPKNKNTHMNLTLHNSKPEW